MSKPEDISQEAWDAADITFDLETYGDGGLYHLDAQIKIARSIDTAITAAVAAERESCASEADTHSKAKWGGQDDRNTIVRIVSQSIAAAIRNRTATQETR